MKEKGKEWKRVGKERRMRRMRGRKGKDGEGSGRRGRKRERNGTGIRKGGRNEIQWTEDRK